MPTKYLIPFAALLLVTAGCGKKTSQKTSVGGVTVEQKGDTVSLDIKGKDGNPGMKVSASEKGVPLPTNFPKDIPLFKDAIVTLNASMGDMSNVQTKFKAPLEEGMKFYEVKLKDAGWTVTVMKMEGMNMVTGKKGDRQYNVIFTTEDKLTVAQIMTQAEGK